MGLPKFSRDDFFQAALAIIAERGVSGMTVGLVARQLGAPIGSFYHRFASRDVLLGSLWLNVVLDFQVGIRAALDAGDGLRAALHTPAWVRSHPDEARLLLLYDRQDFQQDRWPQELRAEIADMGQRLETGAQKWAKAIFGREGREEIRLAQFLISELPVTAVRQHLMRGERPPPLCDSIVRATYRAVLADYRARKRTRVSSAGSTRPG